MNLHQRASGVLLHVTSLPGPHGIGDFGPEAFHFVDWLASAGQSLWQWLPVSPIGPGDSPYQSVSAFAGSPLMVALEPLVTAGWLPPPQLPEGGFDPARVDYARVVPWRLQQLRAAARGFFDHATPQQHEVFEEYQQTEAGWLDDYALFMALETAQGGRCWWEWPEPLKRRDPAALKAAKREQADEIGFWQFVQWCFDTQAASLKRYAAERRVRIMGDLPIFVAHHSADCWARPDLYTLDEHFQPTVVAGVPPDDLGPLGQRWGNPLYRWDRMADEGWAWWAARVQRALAHADVFRIDHFRGFAGYFEIPADSEDAKQGRWRQGPGQALFDAIAAQLGELPIVAEDLGYITPDVHTLRDGCGFPGMKILQFAFGGNGAHEYLPHNYPRHCLVYTGTHDNDTVRGWWNQARPHERAFAGAYLACHEHDVHWAMIRAAWNSVADIALCPFQDVLGLATEHRMNTPGTQGPHNWSWRFNWPMVGGEPGRVLRIMTEVSGRLPGQPPPSPPSTAGYWTERADVAADTGNSRLSKP